MPFHDEIRVEMSHEANLWHDAASNLAHVPVQGGHVEEDRQYFHFQAQRGGL
jgi:hypothetical protein